MSDQNGTGKPSITEQLQILGLPTDREEIGKLVLMFGKCRPRTRMIGIPMPHDWHPLGQTSNQVSLIIGRACCYCAPVGVGIVVRTFISEGELQTERMRHGERLIFELVQIAPRGTGILTPDRPGFNLPPDLTGG